VVVKEKLPVFFKTCVKKWMLTTTFFCNTGKRVDLSPCKVFARLFKIRREFLAFLAVQNHEHATNFLDNV